MEEAKNKQQEAIKTIRGLIWKCDEIKIVSEGYASDNSEKVRIITQNTGDIFDGIGEYTLSIEITPFFKIGAGGAKNHKPLELSEFKNPVEFLLCYLKDFCGINNNETLVKIAEKTKYVKGWGLIMSELKEMDEWLEEKRKNQKNSKKKENHERED